MKNFIKRMLSCVLLPAVLVFFQACDSNMFVKKSDSAIPPLKIMVGYQSTTAQTWGALIIKNQQLFEKKLQKLLPDASANIQVEWFNASAGSVLNNNMIGGKIQLSFLGDMPALLNGIQGVEQPNYKSVLIALDGKGKEGTNQSILVPIESHIKRIEDLEGKTVSTPVGSSAHRMLLETLEAYNLLDKVTVVDQSVTFGMQSIEQNKIEAHATWEPYSSFIEFREVGKVLQTVETVKTDYLTAVVANRGWAEQNRAYVIAFLMALHEAHQFVLDHPDETAEIFAKESEFPLNVCRKMVDSIRFDAAIYERDILTLKNGMLFLTDIGKIKSLLNLSEFIDDSYLREAMKMLDKPYLTIEELNGEWVEKKQL